MFAAVKAQEYAYSESYYQSKPLLFVNIVEPTYSFPITGASNGSLIYILIDVDFNGTNVTNLTKDNFAVDIGLEKAIVNDAIYDDKTSYYRLNVTLPSNELGTKQDFWVNVTYNNFWKTDIEIEAVWYFVPTTTTIALIPSPPSPPLPVPPPLLPKIVNFTVDLDLIKVLLTPGKSEKRSVKVSNVGKNKVDVTAKIRYLEQLSSFKTGGMEYRFDLDLNETKEIEINFFAEKDQEPGVYSGKIVFTGDSIERTVLVVVEVESEKPLFDVKVEVLPEYRIVYPGDRVMAQLTVYNLGRVGRVDSELEYGIKALDGTVIMSEREMVAVETQLSTVKGLDLPTSIKPGSYVFYSTVTYNGVVGTGSSMFTVAEKFKTSIFLLAIMLFVILIIFIIFSFHYLGKKKKKKKSRRKRRKFKKK